jgi:hypothetical protein
MYVFQLPEVLPPVGRQGGSPKAAEFHAFGVPMPDYSDARVTFLNCIRDPDSYSLRRKREGHYILLDTVF